MSVGQRIGGVALAMLIAGTGAAFAQPSVDHDRPQTVVSGDPSDPVERLLSSEDLDRRIRDLVAELYLSGEDLSADQISSLYASRVQYFGGREITLGALIRDKMAYYRRWPERSYTLVPGSLSVSRDKDRPLVYVSFTYDFALRGPGRASSGRGAGRLALDFSMPGGKLVREDGKLLRHR